MTLAGCDEETTVERVGAARITPNLSVDGTLIAANGQCVDDESLHPSVEQFAFELKTDDHKYNYKWESIADYPTNEMLIPGIYTATASFNNELSEGIGMPYFTGSTQFSLASGVEKEVALTAELASAAFKINLDSKISQQFQTVTTTLHSKGYSYITVNDDNDDIIYLQPGCVNVTLNLTTDNGEYISINTATVKSALAKHLYEINFKCDEDRTITTNVDGAIANKTTITPELLAAPSPIITPIGFTDGETVTLAEGNTPKHAIGFSISEANANSLILTTVANSLTDDGWPTEIDLCHATDSELKTLENKGLILRRNVEGYITDVDVTNVTSHLRATDALNEAKFMLQACSASGKQSNHIALSINIEPIEMEITSMSTILLGENIAKVTVASSNANFNDHLTIQAIGRNSEWVDCEIISIKPTSTSEHVIEFKVPLQTKSTQEVQFKYCNKILATAELKRIPPKFHIEVDAFALSAKIRIIPEDDELKPLITTLAKIYVNGTETLGEQRDRDNGILHIVNLTPNTFYTITASLMDNPTESEMTQPVKIHTENTLQVTNSNFMDHTDGPTYKNLPCGGVYSQSIIDIYNRMNYTSYDLEQPRFWANTNAKTFNHSAKNHNTWYMTPSVYSDIDNVEAQMAVVLQSVAWDIDGEEITPYRQQANQYIAYNPNVPRIKHRAAGKIFLGKYDFDPATLTETYDEGIDFPSRPIAINGVYHFTPAPNALADCGLVKIEVIGMMNGKEVEIASNVTRLEPALTFTAFSVPLTYNYFGVKATKLKIMIASSTHIGTIEEESAQITTYSDPIKATSIGGTLWIQSISLSYL